MSADLENLLSARLDEISGHLERLLAADAEAGGDRQSLIELDQRLEALLATLDENG